MSSGRRRQEQQNFSYEEQLRIREEQTEEQRQMRTHAEEQRRIREEEERQRRIREEEQQQRRIREKEERQRRIPERTREGDCEIRGCTVGPHKRWCRKCQDYFEHVGTIHHKDCGEQIVNPIYECDKHSEQAIRMRKLRSRQAVEHDIQN